MGKVIKREDGTGLVNFKMEIFVISQMLFEEKVGEVVSKESGEFKTSIDDKGFFMKYGPDWGVYLVVYNANGVLISNGRYDQQGRIIWSAKNLVMFDMTFPSNAVDKKPPKFDETFDEKAFFNDLKDIK